MKKLLALLVCMMAFVAAAVAEEPEASAPILELHQLAIGYADSYYIRCGDVEILIDAGNPNPGAVTDDIVNFLRAAGAGKLDVMIITHWHLDHCEKMNEVLAEFGDENTMVYGASEQLPETAAGNKSDRANTPVEIQISPLANGTYRQMKFNDVTQIGDMTITCTGPETVRYNGNQNKDSLNFLIQYGERRFLFTGDYGHSNEINKYFTEFLKNVDVLKFPHHGGMHTNKDGKMEGDIGPYACKVVNPAYVLVPSNNNNWQVYWYLHNQGLRIERDNVFTQRAGHVVILTDGGEYIEAKTQQNPEDYAPKAE